MQAKAFADIGGFSVQDAVQQAQSKLLQTWLDVKAACQHMPNPDDGNLTACEKLAEAETALLEGLQPAEELKVSKAVQYKELKTLQDLSANR